MESYFRFNWALHVKIQTLNYYRFDPIIWFINIICLIFIIFFFFRCRCIIANGGALQYERTWFSETGSGDIKKCYPSKYRFNSKFILSSTYKSKLNFRKLRRKHFIYNPTNLLKLIVHTLGSFIFIFFSPPPSNGRAKKYAEPPQLR